MIEQATKDQDVWPTGSGEPPVRPSPDEIQKALKAIETLCVFEAQQVLIRGYGSGLPHPSPELVKLLDWLRAGAL